MPRQAAAGAAGGQHTTQTRCWGHSGGLIWAHLRAAALADGKSVSTINLNYKHTKKAGPPDRAQQKSNVACAPRRCSPGRWQRAPQTPRGRCWSASWRPTCGRASSAACRGQRSIERQLDASPGRRAWRRTSDAARQPHVASAVWDDRVLAAARRHTCGAQCAGNCAPF